MSFIDDKSFFEREKAELDRLEQKGTKKMLRMYDFGASKLRAEIKKRPAQYFFLFITTFIGSVITSSFALFGGVGNVVMHFTAPNLPAKEVSGVIASKVIETEKFDHLLLASKLRKEEEDFILIDIRSAEEYRRGHILSAINVPVYESGMVTSEGDLDVSTITKGFKGYKGDKLVILYGVNSYSSIPADIAKVLTKKGIKAKSLTVGFDEWAQLQQ